MIKNKKALIISLAISLGAGAFSAFLTMGEMDIYKKLNLPPLSPPSWLFPVVWTILFALMGISAYIIYMSEDENKTKALIVYGLQLVVNVIWPVLFFKYEAFLLAFVWLLLLWFLVFYMIKSFYSINKPAAILQLPYLLWITFEGYLNLMIYLLN